MDSSTLTSDMCYATSSYKKAGEFGLWIFDTMIREESQVGGSEEAKRTDTVIWH